MNRDDEKTIQAHLDYITKRFIARKRFYYQGIRNHGDASYFTIDLR